MIPEECQKVATEPYIIRNSILKEETHLRQRSGLDETVAGSTSPLLGGLGIEKNLFEMDGGQLKKNGKTDEELPKNNTPGLLVFLAITSITLLFTGFGVFLGHVRCLQRKNFLNPVLTIIFLAECPDTIWNF